MTASNLTLLDSKVRAIFGFVEAVEQTTNNHRATQIIVGSISFVLIAVLVGVSGIPAERQQYPNTKDE